jgi:hypothetical protein
MHKNRTCTAVYTLASRLTLSDAEVATAEKALGEEKRASEEEIAKYKARRVSDAPCWVGVACGPAWRGVLSLVPTSPALCK